MRIGLEIVERSVRALEREAGLGSEKLRALERNPFLESLDSLGKIAGLADGREIGGEYVFPILIKADGAVCRVLAGSTLYVDEKFRKSGLGLDLPELRWQKSPSGVAIGAGLSQMAVPVHQLLDYNVFLLPRLLMLWKSRSVVEMKLTGVAAPLVSAMADVAIGGYALLMRLAVWTQLRGFEVSNVSPQDDGTISAVAKLIETDSHRYGEVHDARWIKWHLTESFSVDGPAQLMVIRKSGAVVGFWMTKRRFHAQASHRGFKNVWLGSIIEWQVTKGFEKKLPWLLLSAALILRKQGVDAVELPTDDELLHRFFRHLGWRTVGEGNLVIKAGPTSSLANDEELKKQSNWRLRPAMGDNGLS